MKKALDDLMVPFLEWLTLHNQYQEKRNAEAARTFDEQVRRRYGEPLVLDHTESIEGCAGSGIIRPLNREEAQEAARPRSKVRGGKPAKKEARPVLLFTPIMVDGIERTADVFILEMNDTAAATTEIVQLETARADFPLNCAWSFTHNFMGDVIPGRTASVWADTSMKDSEGNRVFAEVVRQSEEVSGGLILAGLRSFTSEELPDRLPESVDLAEFEADQLAKARKAWALKHREPGDVARERAEAAIQSKIAEGIAAGLDALGRPRKEPTNPMQAAL